MFLPLTSSRCCRLCQPRPCQASAPTSPGTRSTIVKRSRKGAVFLAAFGGSEFLCSVASSVTTGICVSDPADTTLSQCDWGRADRCSGKKEWEKKNVLSVSALLLPLRRNLHLPFKRVPCKKCCSLNYTGPALWHSPACFWQLLIDFLFQLWLSLIGCRNDLPLSCQSVKLALASCTANNLWDLKALLS